MRVLLGVVLGVAALAATSPSASADDVWLWACHGPGNEALPAPLGQQATGTGSATSDCGAGGALHAPGNSGWTFQMPSGAALNAVRIFRTVTLGTGDSYELRAGATPLETQANGSEATYNATGAQVAFSVTCADGCAGATVPAIGFRVSDTGMPQGSVGGVRSPASDTLALDVSGRDDGLGLQNAVAYLDNQPVASGTFSDPGCKDISASPGVDLPFALVAQSDAGNPGDAHPVGCVTRGTAGLAVNTTAVPNGAHRLEVRVSDLAGNTASVLDQTIEVQNATPPPPGPTTHAPASSSSGGDTSSTATSCLSPELKVRLADKPVRTVKQVPVLLSGGRYKFQGHLTCRVGQRRREAPKHAIIDILSQIGKTTRPDYGTTTAPDGIVSVILSFTESRTLIFRFIAAEGGKTEVRIPIIIETARPFRPKVDIHAIWLRFVTPFERVRFSALRAGNVPKGATVTVTCSGGGCPAARRAAHPRRRRKTLSVLGPLASSDLRPGASVNVTVTKPGYIGVGKLYCVRSGQRVRTLAYRVGADHPSC